MCKEAPDIFDVGYFMAWPRVVALCGAIGLAFGLYSLFEIPKPGQAQAWPAGEDARQRAVPAEPIRSSQGNRAPVPVFRPRWTRCATISQLWQC